MASDEPPRFHIVYWHKVDAGDGSGSMVVRFDVPAMSYKGESWSTSKDAGARVRDLQMSSEGDTKQFSVQVVPLR
jgi:hypothetical protein